MIRTEPEKRVAERRRRSCQLRDFQALAQRRRRPPRHLREQLGWTWQRPARRALERDDAAIEQWVNERWPQLKKEPGASTR